MNIDLILRIAAIGILVSVLNGVLDKSDRKEQTMYTTLAGVIIVLLMLITEIKNLFEAVQSIFKMF